MQWLLKRIVGTKNERDLKRLRPIVARINALEQEYQSLSEDALRAKTVEFKGRVRAALEQGPLAQQLRDLREALGSALDEKEKLRIKRDIRAVYNSVLDPILPEAFAVVKNACRRLVGRPIEVCGHSWTWEMVPFDVQLIGGIALHEGKIAEMATGEGKTLVATLPAYLNALTASGVHVVTVNDFLARRDAQWMGTVYQYLGLSVGCIQNQMFPQDRRVEYAKDITYGTNSEFGFDYLRDKGMAFRPEEQVQRDYYYAIIDEVDSILIDEARTPLIISGPAPYSTQQFAELKAPVERLWRRQRDLCNRLMQEAKELLDEGRADAGLYLWLVKRGHPKNKQLQHLMEEPSARQTLEQTENQLMSKASVFESLVFGADDLARPESLAMKIGDHKDPVS
ncbi:MAG: preprotein translocase subunit SecA, partial [Kiritimatiellae bacterium]|nr:preprotein translocase subunit SecA [Kiritimatiellia bacterium]